MKIDPIERQLTEYRARGMRAFEVMRKASGRRDFINANREYFALGYATALTEEWKKRQIKGFWYRWSVKFRRAFVRVFTGHGPKVLALVLSASAYGKEPECPKHIVSNILACDVSGCLVLKLDGTKGKAKLPVELGAIVPICPLKTRDHLERRSQ